jgi:amidohydrolase
MSLSRKLIQFLFVSTLFCLSHSSSTEKEQEQEETKTLKHAVRGAAAQITKSAYINEVVDSFFVSNDEPTNAQSLKEEINLLANTDALKSFLVSLRRQLHRHPEVMYQESFTSQTIQTVLSELDIKYTTGWSKNTHQDVYKGQGGYGIVAEIGTGASPCIILRADMDALPIDEATNDIEAFKSKTRGKMHACGHDGHTTMLLGAAAVLKKMENSLQGTVRLMFQPAEEGGAGAKRMIEEGVIRKEPKAELAFGMHVWPALPSRTIASRPGTLMAAAETFQIIMAGKGGHAAMPHLTIDPIVAAASTIMNLQPIISRNISPLESGVVSITQMTAGDAYNVIPAAAIIKGTIRALTTEMLMSLRNRVEHVVNTTSILYGCNSTIRYSPDYYPNAHNDKDLFEHFSKKVGGLVSSEGYVRDIEPTMGGEDFAFLSKEIPSTFFFIGQGSGGDEAHHVPPTDFGLHHPKFALDEDVMSTGVELHVNLAVRALKKLNLSDDKMTSEL